MLNSHIVGSADFLGYNMYTSTYVEASVSPLSDISYEGDMDVITEQDSSWTS